MRAQLAWWLHSALRSGDRDRRPRTRVAVDARFTRGVGTVALGVLPIEESYDVSANVFSPVDQRKKAPPMIALEPRTLALVRRHRRYLTQRSHPGLKTGLLFPSKAGTRPVGND